VAVNQRASFCNQEIGLRHRLSISTGYTIPFPHALPTPALAPPLNFKRFARPKVKKLMWNTRTAMELPL
jgi:hypothetical protein